MIKYNLSRIQCRMILNKSISRLLNLCATLVLLKIYGQTVLLCFQHSLMNRRFKRTAFI